MTFQTEGDLVWRPMQPSDILPALQIISQYDEDDAYDARETYEESVEGQFVLTERNKVIGCVGAKAIENTDRAYGLSWTYLQKADRRTAKAGKMLDWTLDWLRESDCRKVFVNASDYSSADEGDIYFDSREGYMRAGFMQELRQPDFYAPGESMIVYGLRLQPQSGASVPPQVGDIQVVDVDEIPETNESYWIAWELVDPGRGTKANEFDKIIREVKSWGGRSVYAAFSSDLPNAASLMSAARFRMAGRLIDYYEDGVDEVHYRYDLLG